MIEDRLLWELIQMNAAHIGTINSELGGILATLKIHTTLIIGQFAALTVIFVTNIIHLRITKKNGNNNKK